VRQILFMSAGVALWALHFAAIYGLSALACARGRPELVLPSVVIATTLAAAATIAVLGVGLRGRARFESWLASGIAALALVAIVWEALPVLIVPICT
jgi:hypothetical protein